MAGDWIKMRKNLLSDPHVVRIMSALNADRFRTVGGLFAAWCLLDEQTDDGMLDGYTAEVFDELVGIPGLARAMERVGWLEIGPDFVAATRFSEHNGKTAKRRATENVRKMSARHAEKPETKSALEKRREEKRKVNTLSHSKGRHFENEEFKAAWDSWKAKQAEANFRPMDEVTEEAQLYSLESFDTEEAIAIVRFSTSRTNCRNLITNGDHKPKESGRPKKSIKDLILQPGEISRD